MPDEQRSIFTKEMKASYTLLMPMMAQPHFQLLAQVLQQDGYHVKLLQNSGEAIARTGLRYVHNDMCYPAILVIGQFIDALQNGGYDLDRTALVLTQTGGGCRASNYIFLLRKALVNSGFGQIPVLSVNLGGLGGSGLPLSPRLLMKCLSALTYGDFLLCLYNQSRSHETVPGSSKVALDCALQYMTGVLARGGVFGGFEKHLRFLLSCFTAVEQDGADKPKVGIVGEIYLKYSKLANNNLEDSLIAQGAEPVVSGLLDFMLYCIYNMLKDGELYHKKSRWAPVFKSAINLLVQRQRQMTRVVAEHSSFRPPHDFSELPTCAVGIISTGVKMGEGWLLGAEIASHIEHGVSNIVSVQPFGCLPNHIASKGIMGNIRAKYPGANVVAIDYDPGASRINQENRLKLMLMNAGEKRERATVGL